MKQPIADLVDELVACFRRDEQGRDAARDRKSTRLNSSH